MAKKVIQRTRMTESEVEAYLKRYAKERDLKGAELNHAIRRCAATRWAALERNAKGSKPKAKAKAKPKAKATPKAKKAA